MKGILKDELTPQFKQSNRLKQIVFSFYYTGNYGPHYWFGYDLDKRYSGCSTFFLEQQEGVWKQECDVGKYPVVIAIFDLGKKHKLYHKNQITKADIDAFLDDCHHLDEIIKTGMEKDPGHYSRVQQL
jgi:hypothetical protein